MQVILLDKLVNLGDLGDQVSVRSGYARNFLIPKGKAIAANKKNIESFLKFRADQEVRLVELLDEAKNIAKKIEALKTVTITSKTGGEGKLFGSIGARDIVKSVRDSGVEISKNTVRLSQGLIRVTGEHPVSFQLHREVAAKLIVIVFLHF